MTPSEQFSKGANPPENLPIHIFDESTEVHTKNEGSYNDKHNEGSRHEWFSSIKSADDLRLALQGEQRLSPKGDNTDYSNEFIERIINRLSGKAAVEAVVAKVFHRDARLVELLLRVLAIDVVEGESGEKNPLTFEHIHTRTSLTDALLELDTIVDEAGKEWSGEEMKQLLDSIFNLDVPLEALAKLPEIHGIRSAAIRVYEIEIQAIFREYGQPELLHDISLLRPDKETIQAGQLAAELKMMEAFESKFSLSAEDLATIEGWETLQSGQKQLILENLAGLTVGRIEEEAKDDYKNSIETERSQKTLFGSNFLRKAWVNVRESFLEKKHVGEWEKVNAGHFENGGLRVHKQVLTELVTKMHDRGPNAYFDAHNELVIEYAPAHEKMTAASEESLRKFNHVAYYEGKKTYESTIVDSYEELQEKKEQLSRYETARQDLMTSMEADGIPPQEVLQYMANVDKQVMLAQFERTHPDALKLLGEIEDRGTWRDALKNSFTEGGLYAAGGYITRSIATGLFGILAAPAVAASIGGFRAWKRSEAELRELDRKKRAGHTSETEGVRNMVTVAGKSGVVSKLRLLVKRLESVDQEIENKPEERARLEEERARIASSLKERIEHTEDIIKLGLVNFGANTRTNQYLLLKELAATKVFMADAESNDRLHNRLKQLVVKDEKEVAQARTWRTTKEVAKGALTAGSFSFFGVLLADFFDGTTKETAPVSEKLPSVPEIETEVPVSGVETPVTPEVEVTTTDSVEASIVEKETGSHPVAYGDTLTALLRDQVAAIADLATVQEQNSAIENFLTKLSPAELREVGVSSGNYDLLYVGEQIDMARLAELFSAKS
jgi:hypothetical protein